MNQCFPLYQGYLLFVCFALNEIEVMYGGDADGDGMLLMTIGIEDQLVEPATSTTCVTGIGLGSSDLALPAGVEAMSARIDRVNRITGKASPVENFRFAPDADTTAGMAAGGGSGIDDPRPIIDGANWFGFSSSVEPFVLETESDEYIRMTFELRVPENLVPFMTEVQFASGEGQGDGTPIFSGEHPVEYYTGEDSLVWIRKFLINAGLNDAWLDPLTLGQGFFIAVFPDLGQMFLSWFTYEVERPDEEIVAQLGEPGHRWLTAQGLYADDLAVLDIDVAEGGVFDSEVPKVTHSPDGTMVVQFTSCNAGTISYDIPSVDRQGVVPIERIVPDNVALCEALDKAGQPLTTQ
jgi:hypothetical protein